MANGIKHYLDSVVSIMQSAFIPGRQIHNNIMLAQLMIHHCNHHSKDAGMVFIDFAHAYDFISQEYILEVLETMDFPDNFCNLIRVLMANQDGRVLVNGDLSPYFKVENGGKQGDPLFPLIYIIALEGLSALFEADLLQVAVVGSEDPRTATC